MKPQLKPKTTLDCHVKVRCTAVEKLRWEEAAVHSGQSLSETIRTKMNGSKPPRASTAAAAIRRQNELLVLLLQDQDRLDAWFEGSGISSEARMLYWIHCSEGMKCI